MRQHILRGLLIAFLIVCSGISGGIARAGPFECHDGQRCRVVGTYLKTVGTTYFVDWIQAQNRPSAPPPTDPEREKLFGDAYGHAGANGFDTIEEYQTHLKDARDHGYDSIEDYQKILRDKQDADLAKEKRDREEFERR
jgi:hypothetical protein